MADDVDLNLLPALDALLGECSVGGAARRLGVSDSAMSRTLARLRSATGDELLVRAGRGLVLTPQALVMREQVRELVHAARQALSPAAPRWEAASARRVFTLRANDGFVEAFGPRLVSAVMRAAPGVRLRFAPKPDKDVRPLREGLIDLDIGVLGESGPEVRVQALYRDRFVGAARIGHPLWSAGPMTPQQYAACPHVVTSRRGRELGPVDIALHELGHERSIGVIVPSFRAAMEIAAESDLLALVPESFFTRRDGSSRLRCFDLPVATPAITISHMWHPRVDRDPAHRWLRGVMREACSAPSDARVR